MESSDVRPTVTATALDNEARGIAVLPSGKKVFVPELLPGETAVIEIIKEDKKYSVGILKELLVRSPDRVLDPGKIRPGCNLSHLSYPSQLKYKEDKVFSCLERIGRVPPGILSKVRQPIIKAEITSSYRNHMQYKIVNGKCCLMLPGTNDPVYEDKYLPEYEIFSVIRRALENVFRDAPTNLFSELILRGSQRTRELLIELVSCCCAPHECTIRDTKDYLRSTGLAEALTAEAGSYKINGITLRISESRTKKRTRTGKRVTLEGKDSYREKLCGRTFEVKAGAFFQVNTDQAEKLYNAASVFLKDTGTIYDIYCGTGSIGLSVISEGQELIGLESVREAVESAKINASLSGITNAVFICKDAESSDLFSGPYSKPDAVIVDPPRKGMHVSFTDKLIKAAPPRIIYISCDPATLGRDILALRTGGYEIVSVTPADLFPMCSHCETLVYLKR
ncbi:MAG: class I SAM-dependent RNA methyltransferase [Clostridiales bacterium]|nr:class I SAM-dependent RNA methyltransferase [Clostridiales bacterium]